MLALFYSFTNGVTWHILLLFSILCIYYFVSIIRRYRRLAHVPGPPSTGFSILWLLYKDISARQGENLAEVNNKFGSLARVGPNLLITSDASVVRRMSAARSEYSRSVWQKGMRVLPRIDNIFSITDDRIHDALRKKLAPAYSRSDNPGMEPYIDLTLTEMTDLLDRAYIEREHSNYTAEPLDLARLAGFFTVDVITRLAFGKPFGDLRENTDKYGYIAIVEDCLRPMTAMANFPGLLRFLEWTRLLDLISAATLGKTIQIIEPIVDARLAEPGKPKHDMLGTFIQSGLSKRQLLSETTLQLSTGSDTTSTAIRSTLLCIITNPHVLGRLRAEFDMAHISSPITDSEARQLPYLQATIKEGLRLFPPVTALLAKEVPAGGDLISGYHIPGGTKIAWSALALQRSLVFGSDPHTFRPERWLEAAPHQLQEMSSTLELVFGSGKYQCLGRAIALLELNKVFVELLRRYDFAIINPEQPWHCINAGLWAQSKLYVRVLPRDLPRTTEALA